MDIQIRNESKNDIEQIHRVITLAFQNAPHTCHTEQFIVKALRRADALVLSQLAVKNGQVIGISPFAFLMHIAISPVNISDDLIGLDLAQYRYCLSISVKASARNLFKMHLLT